MEKVQKTDVVKGEQYHLGSEVALPWNNYKGTYKIKVQVLSTRPTQRLWAKSGAKIEGGGNRGNCSSCNQVALPFAW